MHDHAYICLIVVQSRPLPPVPASISTSVPSSPVEIRHRPLPAPPVASQGIHIHSLGPQISPIQKRKIPPPAKPAPYRKNKSEPLAPPISLTIQSRSPRSASLSPPCPVLAEDYQEFVCQTSFDNSSSSGHYDLGVDVNSTEDNYSLATSGESRIMQQLTP